MFTGMTAIPGKLAECYIAIFWMSHFGGVARKPGIPERDESDPEPHTSNTSSLTAMRESPGGRVLSMMAALPITANARRRNVSSCGERAAVAVWNASSAAEIAAMMRATFLRESTYAPFIFAHFFTRNILPYPAQQSQEKL